MEIIRTYAPDTDEYARLKTASVVLTAVSPKHITYTVEDTYFDFGQDWMWTTIIDSRDVQILSPRDWEEVVLATTADELLDAVKNIMNDKYFGDR